MSHVILRLDVSEVFRAEFPPGEYIIGREADVDIYAGHEGVAQLHPIRVEAPPSFFRSPGDAVEPARQRARSGMAVNDDAIGGNGEGFEILP